MQLWGTIASFNHWQQHTVERLCASRGATWHVTKLKVHKKNMASVHFMLVKKKLKGTGMGPICRLGWHEGRAEGWSGSGTFLIDLAGLYGPSDTSRPSIVSVQSDRGASCNSKSSEGEEWRNKPPHSFSLEAAITHTQTHAYTLYWHIQTLEINMQTGMFVVCLGCTEALQQCGKKSHAGYAVSAALSRPEGWQTIWLVGPLWAGKFDRGNGAGGWKEIFHGICRKHVLECRLRMS